MDYNAPMDASTAALAPSPAAETPAEAELLAQQWQTRLATCSEGQPPAEAALPQYWIEAAAHLIRQLLNNGQTVELIVPDDETLPDLSNALDLDLRPLCLVLPEADFVSRIAMRATLTLLKSRLTRQADTNPAWQVQHARIALLNGVWQNALHWGQSDAAAWPEEIGHLFPARLLPASHALFFAVPADVHVLVAPERMSAATRDTLAARGKRVLCLSAWQRGGEHRQLIVLDEAARTRFELDLLTREIAELELELTTAQQEVASFSRRYHHVVGPRMVELDGLQAELARRRAAARPADAALREEAERSSAQAEHSQQEQQHFDARQEPATQVNFAPSTDLKRLYRQIAQKIHPDRADSEEDRQHRTRLMAEATRAYRGEDEAALQSVLRQWETGIMAGAAPGSDAHTLTQQVQKMKQRLGQIQLELDRLLGSRLYELLVASRMASRQGRDLLEELASELDQQIRNICTELADAPPPGGEQPCDLTPS